MFFVKSKLVQFASAERLVERMATYGKVADKRLVYVAQSEK